MQHDLVNKCVYTVYIRTSSIISGGTDSNIALQLYDKHGDEVDVPNLVKWGGLMPAGHDYFERGNLDIFSGRGPCLSTPVCAMNLTSDGTGPHAGWYCDYVEVTSTGPHIACSQQLFKVERWLALDAPPYNLTAIVNDCPADVTKRPGQIRIRPGDGSAAECDCEDIEEARPDVTNKAITV